MTQSAPTPATPPQPPKLSRVEAILQTAAKEAGLEDFNEVPAVTTVVVRTNDGRMVEWVRFNPVPGKPHMKIIAMFQVDDAVRVYAWPMVEEVEGRPVFPSRYTLRTQGSIPLVHEEMTGPVAMEELEKELYLLLGVDPEDLDDDTPETSEPTVNGGFTPPTAPAVPTPATF
ncbi:MAG TPA: hypothetical protein VEZ44_09230 [bacterium]|nr:hypothetical protein [bacterium]